MQERDGTRWRNLGVLLLDRHYRPSTLELSTLGKGRHTLRIVHHGRTAAQLDALQIDGAPAAALRGAGHDAQAKLAAADYDVIDRRCKGDASAAQPCMSRLLGPMSSRLTS